MTRLSVNVNKVATLRNARGGQVPSLLDAVDVCLRAGTPGITVHPRADERHITRDDVRRLAAHLAPLRDSVEFNIEGDPRPDFVELVLDAKPHQCTLVPVRPGEITSEAGWARESDHAALERAIRSFREAGIRVSLFVNPDPDAIRWVEQMGAQRIELYTEPYARAHAQGGEARDDGLRTYARAAGVARACNLGVNAGHDLDLNNLADLAAACRPEEVSIGHALISRALFVGLDTVVREYLDLLAAPN